MYFCFVKYVYCRARKKIKCELFPFEDQLLKWRPRLTLSVVINCNYDNIIDEFRVTIAQGWTIIKWVYAHHARRLGDLKNMCTVVVNVFVQKSTQEPVLQALNSTDVLSCEMAREIVHQRCSIQIHSFSTRSSVHDLQSHSAVRSHCLIFIALLLKAEEPFGYSTHFFVYGSL